MVLALALPAYTTSPASLIYLDPQCQLRLMHFFASCFAFAWVQDLGSVPSERGRAAPAMPAVPFPCPSKGYRSSPGETVKQMAKVMLAPNAHLQACGGPGSPGWVCGAPQHC